MVTSFAFTCCDKIINGLVVVIYHYHELDHHPHQPRKHRNMGCFPFNQKVWFEFWQASAWNSIFQNFQKEDNLVRYTQIFRNLFPEVLFIQRCFLNFYSNCFYLNGLHFRNSTFLGILGNFSTILPLFPNFWKFWLNGKHPSAHRVGCDKKSEIGWFFFSGLINLVYQVSKDKNHFTVV